MAGQNILMPYNFTFYDQKALDFVINTFAHRDDVEISLYHAYTPAPEIDLQGSPVMDKLKGNLNYLSQRVDKLEAGLEEAKENLHRSGFSKDKIHIIYQPRKKNIAGEIVNLVSTHGFNIVVINRKPGKVTRFFTESVFNKIVSALSNTTVCVVS